MTNTNMRHCFIMRCICMVLVLLISGISLTGFSKDDQLNDSVDKIQERYQLINDLTADFFQKTQVKLIDKEVVKKGKLYLKKGGMLRVEYQSKDNKYYVSDGSTIWVYIPGDVSSLQTYAVSEETVPKEGLSFLLGFGDIKKEFKIKKSDAFKKISKGFVALNLIPIRKGAGYKSLDAMFDSGGVMVQLKVLNDSGNITEYELNNIKINKDLKDNLFTLDPKTITE